MPKVVDYAWRFGKRVVDDDVLGLAAQMAYYFLFAIFPAMMFIVTLLPLLPITDTQFMSLIDRFAPAEAEKLLQSILLSRPNIGLLSAGLLAALWSSSSGINAIVRSLNIAYRVKTGRFFIVQRLQSMVLTIGMLIALFSTLLLPVFGKQIGNWISTTLGYEGGIPWIWSLLRWVISLLVLILVFTVLYWTGPNLKIQCRKALPGAIFASVGWIVSSLAFAFYVDNFGTFSRAYGSIGGTIILILWFYITGIFIILGGELNAFLTIKNDECG